MFRHSTNTASFFSVLMAALIFLLSLAGVAAAQGNTSLGIGALQNNTTGQFNTASGVDALFGNVTGNSNTANGAFALFGNTTGDFNTASGVSALLSNRFGDANTASGAFALFNNLTGNNNTASGVNALFNNATGFDNTVSGVQALVNNTTGSNNTASGSRALLSNTMGNNNTAIGVQALDSNTTGSANIAIGTFADVSAGNLINATVIGFGATVNASDKVRLGNNSVTVIEGQVAFTAVSDKTKKENFQPVDGEGVLGKIRALSCRAGTSSATILNSFATTVPWRRISLRPSATTESDRSARRRRSTPATWRGF